MKNTLFFGLHFLFIFLLSSCGMDITVVPKINPGAVNVFSPVSISTVSYTNSTSLNLTYGNNPSGYLEYCLLENDTDVNNCVWTTGSLPTTFTTDAVEEVKVISGWIRNLTETSERVDSNQIVLDTTNPNLTLTSLDGGQSLLGGALAVITWTGSDLNPGATPIRLEYSTNNGTSWSTIVSATSNTGTYNWTLPSVTSIFYLVRITMTDLAGNFVSDVSSANFLVNASSPMITVTAPNGNESYKGGSVQNITWTTSGLPAGASLIKLEYSTNGTIFTTIASGEANDGTYAWTTPIIDSTGLIIKATVTDSFSVETIDQSNTNFRIDSTPPSQPSGLSLQTPSSTPEINATPVIRVSGVVSGDTISLFSDSACTILRGSTTATGITADVTSSSLADATYNFYAKATDPAGNESACSTATVSYQKITATPSLSYSGSTGTTGLNSIAMSITPTTFSAGTSASVVNCALSSSSPELPTGLSVNNSTCEISGTPTQTKVLTTYTIVLTNSFGLTTNSSVNIEVLSNTPLTFASIMITNSNPTKLQTYSLTYGSTSTYTEYCLLENDIIITNCAWTSGVLPTTFSVTATENAKVISGWIRDSIGRISARVDSNSVTLDTTTPIAPTFLALQTPSTTPNQSDTPIIRVSGVIFGNIVTLYADNTCSVPSLKGTTTAAGVTADVTSSSVGSDILISYYATQTDPAGNESVCSTAFVDYTRDTTAPILASAAVSNVSPTATTTYNLTYGAVTGTYSHYCIRENSTVVGGCTWTAGVLPTTFSVTAANGAKVLSVWLRDSALNVSTRVDTNSVTLVIGGNAPVASNLFPISFDEDTQAFITLVYNDVDGDLATTCAVSSLTNVTETTSCSCTLGTCTVGVTGTLNYHGSGSFNYTVTAGGQVSNLASSTLTIDPVDDNPTISNITDQSTDLNTATGAIAFTIDDVDSVVACSDVTGSSSMITLVTDASIVIGGTAPNCSVTMTPENNIRGSTTITLTVTKDSLFNQDSFELFVSGIGWYQEAYIKAVNNDASDQFGSSTSLSGDTLAVGAPYESSNETIITNGASATSDNSNTGSGAAYVYKRTGFLWTQEAYIKAVNNDGSDQFGWSTSLSGDTLAVGALYESSNETTITNGLTASSDNSNPSSGAVYVYKRTGSSWAQEAYIKATNNDISDQFGCSTSLSGDTLAVGAISEDSIQTIITNGVSASSDNANYDSGAVYLYKRTGTSWVQEAYIKAANSDQGDEFGSSISLSGNTLAVGAIQERSNQTTITNGSSASLVNWFKKFGAVYVYKRTGSFWVQEAYVKAVNSDPGDAFGSSISLSGDTLAVGAIGESSDLTTITDGTSASSENKNDESGAVYIYKRTGSSWAQESYIKALNNDVGDQFGWSISLSGDTLAVGAPYESSNETTITNKVGASTDNTKSSSGAVYIYKRTGTSWVQEAYIKAANNDAGDQFGWNASLSGDTLAVGTNLESSNQTTITNGETASPDNSNTASGAVYVYRNDLRLFDPSDFRSSANSVGSITLSWSTAGIKASGYIIAYSLGLNPPNDCSSGTFVDVGNVLTTTISGLLSSAFYSFRICAYDASKTTQGYTTTFNTQSATPEVMNLSTSPNKQTMELSWTSAGGSTTGFVVAYQAGFTAPSDCSGGVDVGNVNTYTITGLTASTQYAFRVCSYDTLMTNSFGVVISDKTLDLGWEQEAYIKADNNDAGDNFGWSSSLSGDTLAVGAPLESSNLTIITNGLSASSNNSNSGSGAVYVYKRTGSSWIQEAYIKAVNSGVGDNFGRSTSLTGNTLVVGVPKESSNQTTITNGVGASSDNSNEASGAVYVYKRTGTSWVQEAYIKAANNDTDDMFGSSTSLSGDTLAVGAIFESSNQTTITNGTSTSNNHSNAGSGAVYIYKRTGSSWTQQAYIKTANNDANDTFGYSTNLSGDTLAVGAIGESSNLTTITNGVTASSNNSNSSSGAVYVYKRTGTSWVQEAYIKSANSDWTDAFGSSLSLSGDSLAVGAIYESSNQTTIINGVSASNDNSNSGSGAVYVYKRTGSSWAQEAYIKAANNNSGDNFGSNLTLSGNTLAVGTSKEASNQTTITNGVSASNDNSNAGSGAVYVYKRTGSFWDQEAYVKAVNNDAGDMFGSSTSLSGDTLVVGAPHESSNETIITNGAIASNNNSNTGSGAVYIYRYLGRLFDPPEFTYSAKTLTSITLTWNKAGLTTAGYRLSYVVGTTPPTDCSSGVDLGNVLTTTVSSLLEGTQYSFRLCSYDSLGNLSEGVTSTFGTESYSPEVLSFTPTPGLKSVTLNWLGGGGATAGFTIAYQAGATAPIDCTSGTIVNVGNVLTYQVTGLTEGTDYAFRICSYDGSNSLSIGIPTNTTTLRGWYQEAYIKAANNNTRDYFGWSTSLSGDTLAVGANAEDSNITTITNGTTASSNNSNSNSGAVYIYKRSGNFWVQEAYIKAANSDAQDFFGTTTSLSGNTLAVGAYGESSNLTTITNGATASSDNTNNGSGAVYIYKRTGSSWAQEAYLKAVNNDVGDGFGRNSLSLSGETLAVGVIRESSNQTTITNGVSASSDNSNNSSGAVYVYKRAGSSWAQEAYIKAANNDSGDNFGWSLSLSGDTLAVGAFSESSNLSTIINGSTASNNNSNPGTGAVYVYKRTGSSWAQEAYIKAVNNDVINQFGSSVSLSGDTLAVGVPKESSNLSTITNGSTASSNTSSGNSGAVYVYKRSGSSWAQEAYIKAVNNNAGDTFGVSTSLSGDTLAVGAVNESSNQTTITNGSTASNNNSNASSGAVYVYKRSGSSWAQEAYIKAANNDAGDQFGSSTSLSGDTLAVGAINEDSSLTTITNGASAGSDNSNDGGGAVYIYRNMDRLFDPSEFTSSAKTLTSITFTWSKAGSLAVGYKIAYAVGSIPPADCSSGTVVDVGNVLTTTISSLLAGTQYSFRICSYDASGNLSPGVSSLFHSEIYTPEVLSISATPTKYTATLNWTSGGGATAGFRIAYQVGTSAPNNCSSGTVVNVGNVLTYQLTGLTAGADYALRICSYDGSNRQSIGIQNTFTTLFGWEQQAYIKASNNDMTRQEYGFIVAMNGDSLAVGSINESSNQSTITNGSGSSSNSSNPGSGAVYVYKRTGSSWAQEAYIKAVNNDAGDGFGRAVTFSGNTLAVGSVSESSNLTTITNGTTASGNNSNASSGAVYVYKRTGSSWAQEAYIKAANNDAGDLFGSSASLNGDTLAVGALCESSNLTTITNGTTASGNNSNSTSGAVYVYKRTGISWAQEAYIKAVNNNTADAFGTSLSLSGDTLAVGATGESSNLTTITNGQSASSNNSFAESGAVYIYKRTGSAWAQEAYIKSSNNGLYDQFGYKISLNGDTLVVGTPSEDSNQTTITNGATSPIDNLNTDSGAVYVYKRTGTSWTQEAYIKAVNNDAGDMFGSTISLSGDTLAVGAHGEDSNQTTITNGATVSSDNSNSMSGAVYVYKRTGSSWAQEAYIKAVNNDANDMFGSTISLSGDTLAVGAAAEMSNQTTITNGTTASSNNSFSKNGAVYVYSNPDRLYDPSDIYNSNNTLSSITLNWSKAGTKAIGYKISYSIGLTAPDDCSAGVDVGNVLTYAFTSLTQSTQYSFRLCSYDSSNNLSQGVTQTFQTLSQTPEVISFSTTPASTSVLFQWQSGGGSTSGFVIVYQLSTPPANCSSGTVVDVFNVASYTLTPLVANTTYGYRICSYTGVQPTSVGVTGVFTTNP